MPSIDAVAARFRCSACGGLTRFNVTVTRTTTYYHHQAVGGETTAEEVEHIKEAVESVKCFYCGHGRDIEVIEGPDTS